MPHRNGPSEADLMPEQFGDLNLGRVTPLWGLINETEPLVSQADRFVAASPTSLTARRFDEAQPAGGRTYVASRALILTALDNNRALLNLLSHGITLSAPWTLLRSTFEASAWVHWILESDDGLERRKRGLRRACLDFREQRLWQDVYVNLSRSDAHDIMKRRAEVTAIYQNEAKRIGITWDQANRRINIGEELPKLAVVRSTLGSTAPLIVGFWRGMSGHAHGFGYAIQTSSTIERSVKVPGGHHITFTVDDDSFTSQAMMTGLLLLTAMQLYIQRSTSVITAR